MIEQGPTNQWSIGVALLVSYAAGLLLTVCIFAAVTLLSGHFRWDIIGLCIGAFPGGMFVFFRSGETDFGAWVRNGYGIYIALAAAGIALRLRAVLWCFVALLLLNIAGCCKMLIAFEKTGWRCETGTPTMHCTVTSCPAGRALGV